MADASPTESPTSLVLGLGNLIREDEGTGPHVIRHLDRKGNWGPDVRLMDGGTGGLHLVGEIADCSRLIVVDAAELGADPGAVRLLADGDMDRFVNRPSGWNVHDVGLPDLFAAAALLPEGLPRRRAVVAVQPASFTWSEHPSAAVSAAIPEAAEVVEGQLARWRAEDELAEVGP
mgnify:CR=1 FL=1